MDVLQEDSPGKVCVGLEVFDGAELQPLTQQLELTTVCEDSSGLGLFFLLI